MRTTISGAVLAFFLVGCSTVKYGPLQKISVDSKPQGASVRLDECGFGSTESAKTPATIFVNRRATLCSLTFTHAAHGSRTVPLLRMRHPYPGVSDKVVGGLFQAGEFLLQGAGEMLASGIQESLIVALPVSGLGAASMAIGGTISGIDGIVGANYRQNRSVVLIDFDKPIVNAAGRYSLASVNGRELPTRTWTARNGDCPIYTNSGSLVLEENGRWTSAITERAYCGYDTDILGKAKGEGQKAKRRGANVHFRLSPFAFRLV